MEGGDTSKSNVFQDLSNPTKNGLVTDTDETKDIQQPTEVESLCVNCGDNGTTTLLLVKIPHYREVIISSFECESCGYRNNDIQSGGVIQPMGVIYKVKY